MEIYKVNASDLLRTIASVGDFRGSALIQFALTLLFLYAIFSCSLKTKYWISRDMTSDRSADTSATEQ